MAPETETNEEYFLDTERVRSLVETVDAAAATHERVPDLLDELRAPFEELLVEDWLPERYCNPPPDGYDDQGEMGRDIAQWLLYRRDRDLVLFTLVIPPGVRTPVHDHLAWGLVGLYGGTQHEEFYRRVDDYGTDVGPAELELVEEQEQGRGDYYELVPPDGDIHAVETTSAVPSVSVHLLGTDVGCLRRHQFDPEGEFVEQFVSHYTNVRCDEHGFVLDEGDGH